MAILATAGVRYEEWIRFAAPVYLRLATLGMVAIAVAIGVRLG